jgi:hypothetical protein
LSQGKEEETKIKWRKRKGNENEIKNIKIEINERWKDDEKKRLKNE